MSEWEDTTTRRLMHAPSLSLFAELNYKRGEINFIKKVVWVLKRSTSQLEIFHTSPSPLKCNKKTGDMYHDHTASDFWFNKMQTIWSHPKVVKTKQTLWKI